VKGRPDPDRWAQGLRSAILARLSQDEHLDELDAEHWVAAWERHATTEGLDPIEDGYWKAAWKWISEQLAPKRDMSAEADDGQVYGG
jgi:hypothetical protein